MNKHLHVIGICGTFMGNLALMARELGYHVTGSDLNPYPPMSDMLANEGVEVYTRYHSDNLVSKPDIVAVGNTISRSNPEVDAMLDQGLFYTSGPQWLFENVLLGRQVVVVAGTHGKTTTTSMIAWILEYAGLNPGYLIGGVAQNLSFASRVGEGEWFVIEGDEYDTAYFDKRSKFIHYRPRYTTLLNLEFDHADIFSSIEDIERQFEYFIRTLPSSGRIIANHDEGRLQETIRRSAVAPIIQFSESGNRDADWYVDSQSEDYLIAKIHSREYGSFELDWEIPGRHNTANALAAIATTSHIGVNIEIALEALRQFKPVKRRLELLAEIKNIRVYDDFAHHPTAIQSSIEAVRKLKPDSRLIAVFEPRSNTMRMGVHGDRLFQAFRQAEMTMMYRSPSVEWETGDAGGLLFFDEFDSIAALLKNLVDYVRPGDTILFMSNGGFDNLQGQLIEKLRENYEQ